jgi:hypothetical protein
VLAGFLERSLDPPAARACGVLLAHARTSDIADAAITLLIEDSDAVVTGDPDGVAHLLDITSTQARIRSA